MLSDCIIVKVVEDRSFNRHCAEVNYVVVNIIDEKVSYKLSFRIPFEVSNI